MKLNVTLTEKKEYDIKLSIVDDNGNETDVSGDKRLVQEAVENVFDSSTGIDPQDIELEIEIDGKDTNVHLVVTEIKPKYPWTSKDAEFDLSEK